MVGRENGYPCVLTWDKKELKCGDRESLERSIELLLKDARVGEKLLYLLKLKAKPPESAANPSQENLAHYKGSPEAPRRRTANKTPRRTQAG